MGVRPSNSLQSPDIKHPAWRALPKGIWALGFGSLFMDASSELIHGLLPVFMVTTLGASIVTVGIIEGVAEVTAAIMKVFSGALSDFLGKRKFLVVLGYTLAAFAKLIFPLATSVSLVFTARIVDRIGKGNRGAPRDSLVADLTPPHMRGAAYGLRQALDSVAALWGLHMAFTQGLLAKRVSDTAPAELLGTGFGIIFNLVSGGSLLLASIIAGTLWNSFGAAATFLAGALFAALATLGLLKQFAGNQGIR